MRPYPKHVLLYGTQSMQHDERAALINRITTPYVLMQTSGIEPLGRSVHDVNTYSERDVTRTRRSNIPDGIKDKANEIKDEVKDMDIQHLPGYQLSWAIGAALLLPGVPLALLAEENFVLQIISTTLLLTGGYLLGVKILNLGAPWTPKEKHQLADKALNTTNPFYGVCTLFTDRKNCGYNDAD